MVMAIAFTLVVCQDLKKKVVLKFGASQLVYANDVITRSSSMSLSNGMQV